MAMYATGGWGSRFRFFLYNIRVYEKEKMGEFGPIPNSEEYYCALVWIDPQVAASAITIAALVWVDP